MDFSDCRVIVLGDAMLDSYDEADVAGISPEAPILVAKLKGRKSVPGGAANTAMNLAALGCRAVLLGCMGDDGEAVKLQHRLWGAGVESMLTKVPGRPTTLKTRIVSRGQQIVRVDREEDSLLTPEFAGLVWEQAEREMDRPFSCAVLSDYGKGVLRAKCPDGVPLAQKLIAECARRGVPVLADPKTADWSVYAGAACLTPNTAELMEAMACPDGSMESLMAGAAEAMDSLGLDRLLLTRSEKGCALFERGKAAEPLLIESRAREVVDVTGAGDSVIACLAACVGSGMEWPEAVRIANAAGGIAVEKLGTAPVSADELEDALALDGATGTLASLGRKICSRERLKRLVREWRKAGDRIVFTNGCFDLLHLGHVKLVTEAARQGTRLVCAVNSDASARRLKGASRPVQGEDARAAVLAAMDGVDAVCIFEEDTPLELIRDLKPDVLVKGGDYRPEDVVGAELLPQWGGRVHIVGREPGFSTTGIVEKISA